MAANIGGYISIGTNDLEAAREFYGNILGCKEGRSDSKWIDFNLFGHQLVCHLNNRMKKSNTLNDVDGKQVPIPHFGVILRMDDWNRLADRLIRCNIVFIIEPYIRFKGLAGEQGTMFFSDPSGNSIEFKAFHDIERELFKKK